MLIIECCCFGNASDVCGPVYGAMYIQYENHVICVWSWDFTATVACTNHLDLFCQSPILYA